MSSKAVAHIVNMSWKC